MGKSSLGGLAMRVGRGFAEHSLAEETGECDDQTLLLHLYLQSLR